MEVDLVGRHPVRRALRLGEPPERIEGQLGGAGGNRTGIARVGEELADRGPGAVRRIRHEHVHVDLRRRLPAPHHSLLREPHGAGHERIEHRLHLIEVGSRIHECAEQHVAGDARGRVDPGETFGSSR